MPVKIYWLHNFGNGSKLGIMARPRGNEWLEEDILSLKKQGVQTIVSLLDRNEIYELGLEKEPELCLQNGIEYVNFPIADRNVPKSDPGFHNFIGQLKEKITAGRHMVIHCRMGIGRSTIIAGCLLITPGYKTDDIIAHISKIRGLRVPDTDEQIAWLKKQE
ncbi:MAG TPA: protein-tyrosine phosphatase family protein [Puia sp.]|nr:protein-tyrosine phosphatase family protein [Puia sp.]